MTIDDKTKISLYAVMVSLPAIVGAIIWLTTVDNKASAAQDQLKDLTPLIIDVRERVIRIEALQKQSLRGK